jgi:hypothetical protein
VPKQAGVWRYAGVCVAIAALAFTVTVRPAAGQAARPAPNLPRMPDGKPNLNGIWQSNNTANWNIQDHQASMGPVVAMGAIGAIPAGLGVVEGNELPYLPAALEKKKQNQVDWLKLDPEVKCYMPGIPRAMYQPYPFQIIQTPTHMLMAFEFASASRMINMTTKVQRPPVETWMGFSRGRWEGDTLVVDVTDQVDQTWFDRAGNHHSELLHVVERYTMTSPDALWYEATIRDPKTFSRPWKMSMPLYRRLEKNAQLLEFKCVEFAEELLYGHLRKKSTN